MTFWRFKIYTRVPSPRVQNRKERLVGVLQNLDGTSSVFDPRMSGEELAALGAGHPFVYRRVRNKASPKLWVLVEHKTCSGARQQSKYLYFYIEGCAHWSRSTCTGAGGLLGFIISVHGTCPS